MIIDKSKEFIAAVESMATKALGTMLQEARVQLDATVPVRTGALKASTGFEQEGLEAQIGTNIPYAKYVYFGTSNMAANPAWTNMENSMEQFLIQELDKGLKEIK